MSAMAKMFWRRLTSWFSLPAERRELVEKNIREEAKADFDFYVLSILAAIIVSLGLIINSGAVIIGGMLIAPMFWPILAMSLGIVKGGVRLLQNSFFTVAKVTILTLAISYIIGFIVPVTEYGTEFFSRAQPTLYELFIALAAGFAGAFIVSYPKLSQAVAGVVIAAALVPPLAVVGLSLAEKDLTNVGGSLLLFLSNLIAVCVMSSLFFLLAKFKPLNYASSKDLKKANLLWSVITLILIFIPLLIITGNAISNFNQMKTVNKAIRLNLPGSEIVQTKINEMDDVLYIRSVVRSSQNIRQFKLETISTELADILDQSVRLQISVIPVLEAGEMVDDGDVNRDYLAE
ncbi:MAG: TIGR00341 family protein [Candidatus Komeilibacteria bacterium]|nr:TIGR00341 family protein [Candidatus Komeilibacteria bacterium]